MVLCFCSELFSRVRDWPRLKYSNVHHIKMDIFGVIYFTKSSFSQKMPK